MMYQCPIQYFSDNLIFNIDKSCWAAYKLTGFDYDFLDDDIKIAMLYKTARFLSGIMSEAQILIVPVEQDSKEHFKNLIQRLDKEDVLFDNAEFHAQSTEAYLEEIKQLRGESNDYRTYIIVKLAEYAEAELITNLRSSYEYLLKDPVNALNVFMSLDTKDILHSKMNSCIKMAEKWFFGQNQKIRLTELAGNETQWLFRRMSFRGINTKVKLFEADQEGQRQWKPRAESVSVGKEAATRTYTRDIVNLFSGSIHPVNRGLRIEHDKDIVSYQTFLVLTNLPDAFEYPGMEWIYMMQGMNLQAEMCIHIQSIEYRAAQKKLDGKKREIESQMEHVMEAGGDIPEDLGEGKAYADALEAELKEMREPILNTSITICLAADDQELLEKRVVTLKNEYEEKTFIIERPLADQVKLYMQGIPSVGCMVKDYMIPITPLTLASGVIGATHELGDKIGPYIGTTGIEEKRVFLSMGQACLRNKSASATFYGNLGVGKSFNANLLMILNILYGGYGLIFDPKAERSHWESELKILQGLITTVTLSGEPSNKGKLDPYNLYNDDIRAADELAINILSELLKIAPTSIEYTSLLEAQRIMQEQERPSMMHLIEILGKFPDTDELCQCARYLARRLKLQAGNGMSQLLFGDGTEAAISLENRLNILQIDNLKLPSPETPKESYTSEENLSTVLMAVLSNFAKKFAMVKRPVFKLILFDESWALGKTVEGVKLYDFLTRMGRSLFTGCIFNGHSVLDLPTEGIKNTISYKFCFQTTNDDEARRMCEYMGLEPTISNKEVLKSLGNGECLFQDLDGHVGILSFDAVFQDLIDVFKTTPKVKENKAEVVENSTADASSDTLESFAEDVRMWEEAAQHLNAEGVKDMLGAESLEEVIKAEEIVEAKPLLDFQFDVAELYRKEVIR